MKRILLFSMLTLPVFPVHAEKRCYDQVEIGDPVQYVIDRCGEPVRSERDIHVPGKHVEVIRGAETRQKRPVQPQRIEKWYYDTSQDRATLIVIQDGGVHQKRRLERGPGGSVPME